MIETAIESLARSGRLVRIREISLGYAHPVKTALTGAVAAFALTWIRYFWYVGILIGSYGLRLLANRAVDIGPPPVLRLFVYGMVPSLAIAVGGSLLALARRWSIRKGRFLVIDVGPLVQVRAGWHVPVGLAVSATLFLTFSSLFESLPKSLAYIVVIGGSILAVIGWEMLHDLAMLLSLSPKERKRAAIEYDLKEALAMDETATGWHVDRAQYDSARECAVLRGEFPNEKGRARVREVALRVRGVKEVRLVERTKDEPATIKSGT